MSTPFGVSSRREFCAAAMRAGAATAVAGCRGFFNTKDAGVSVHLSARPATPTATLAPGIYTLATNGARDAVLSVPARYVPTTPMPLVVSLHGAGGAAEGPLNLMSPYSESDGFLLLVPQSRGQTWDGILGMYGPDIVVIERSLRYAFEHLAVLPQRVFITGFSDGASYALGLGLSNGELFSRVVAFSPGFVTETAAQGMPPIFISHGIEDTVLPIANASRRIVPLLRANGYEVDYREFTGGHMVPATMARAAVDWFMA